MPTSGHEGHDMGKPENVPAHPSYKRDDEHPGYEIQDVNTGGIVTFLGGLIGCIVIFFFLCWVIGKGINTWTIDQDGKTNKWEANLSQTGAALRGEKRENLKSNAQVEQDQLAQVAKAFPTPTLEIDDGNQDTADLHAREDLLLDFYSTDGSGTTRIPIDRAMALIVQRGLPMAPSAAAQPKQLMAGENAPVVTAPLTTGFARTGYELETIEAREQKLEFTKAEGKKD
jgi:hypothetical protein